MKKEKNADKSLKTYIYIIFLAAILISLAFDAAGILLLREALNGAVYFALIVSLIVFPALLALICFIGKKRFAAKISGTDLKSLQEDLPAKREEAEKYEKYYEKKLSFIRFISRFFAAVILLDGIALALFSFSSSFKDAAYPLFALSVLFTGNALARLFPFSPAEAEDADPRLMRKEDYPEIYAAAKKAAEKLNIKCDINLFVVPGMNITVSRKKAGAALYLGVYLLRKLNENELYAVFLHEFSHIKNGNNKYETYYLRLLSGDIKYFSSWIKNLIFDYFDTIYCFNRGLYFYVRTLSEEEKADADMAKYAGAEAAASLLVKCYRAERIEWEDSSYDFVSIFASESPEPHVTVRICEEYDNRVKEMLPVWDELMKREIQSRSATHPITRTRISRFGAEMKTDGKSPSAELSSEYEKAVGQLDKHTYDSLSENYEESRKRLYLEPNETIEKWKQDGEILTADGYRTVVEALWSVGKVSMAEKLCRRAIADLPDTAALYAYFTLGCQMLRRYDDQGIEYIYHALENNNNYIEEGLDMIGSYCCITGNQEKLDEYREKAVKYAEKERGEGAEISTLKRGDRLSKETLPEGGLEELIKVIESASDGRIEAAYLVHKTITDTVFTSAVVLKFTSDCPPEDMQEIYQRIFLYLDTVSYENVDDWQFSLFVYENVKTAGFESIEGSLIYRKE